MKKYLMTGIAALALCVGFTSCSHDVEQLSQEEMTELQTKQVYLNYQKAFVAAFGQPASNHKWGFVDYSQTRTRRAFTNSNQWFEGPEQDAACKAAGLVKPEMVSQDEEDFVTNWFRTHKNPQSEDVKLSTFFVQQVHFGTEVYPTKDINGYDHEVVGGEHMDWLCAYDPAGHEETIYVEEFGWNGYTYTTHDDHLNNFNTSYPQRYYETGADYSLENELKSLQLMMNSSTERFGFSESFNTNPLVEGSNRSTTNKRIYYNYVLVSITYNGKTNYYVGFDYECHGNQGDVQPNGYYDDRIIKIVPGNGVVPSEWDLRIIAEDLNDKIIESQGDPDDSDWDFNDVVLDVKFLGNDNVKIRVTAAGATLPIRINGEDALEVHGLYGKPTNIMINTGAAAAGYPAQAYEEKYPAAATFERTISGVDASYGANIKIEVLKNVNGEDIWFELEAKPGQPASKIGVLPDYNYCSERQDIRGLYSGFVKWVAKQNPVLWWRPVSNN